MCIVYTRGERMPVLATEDSWGGTRERACIFVYMQRGSRRGYCSRRMRVYSIYRRAPMSGNFLPRVFFTIAGVLILAAGVFWSRVERIALVWF